MPCRGAALLLGSVPCRGSALPRGSVCCRGAALLPGAALLLGAALVLGGTILRPRCNFTFCTARARHPKPGRDVVNDLGEQARPVDRVNGAKMPRGFEVGIHIDGLDEVLTVIENPVNGDIDDVLVHEGEHLSTLESSHAPGRGQHDDGQARASS